MSLRDSINGTTAADRVLLLFFVLLSFSGMLLAREVLSSGRDVSIEIDGRTAYRYPLDSDRTVRVGGAHGALTVEIKGKKVRVIEATCPNRICEMQGWTERGVIICLPSRISVIVGGPDKDGGKLDGITG